MIQPNNELTDSDAANISKNTTINKENAQNLKIANFEQINHLSVDKKNLAIDLLEIFFRENLKNPQYFELLMNVRDWINITEECVRRIIDPIKDKFFPEYKNDLNHAFFYAIMCKTSSISLFIEQYCNYHTEAASNTLLELATFFYAPFFEKSACHYQKHDFLKGIKSKCKICLNIQKLVNIALSDNEYEKRFIETLLLYKNVYKNLVNIFDSSNVFMNELQNKILVTVASLMLNI